MTASWPARAPSTRSGPLQVGPGAVVYNLLTGIERWLEAERDQLPLWLPAMLGVGMAAWLAIPTRTHWAAFVLACLGLACGAAVAGQGRRAGRAVAIGALMAAIGCALIWWRAERVAAPVLARPVMTQVEGDVARVEPMPARDMTRLTLSLASPHLPPRVRVNVADKDVPIGLTPGARVRLRARLMPPGQPAVPGAYDFARVAWFAGLGATGRALGPIEILTLSGVAEGTLRARLTRHIQSRVDGSAGGVAAALVTGDRGAIAEADDEAMRQSGLAHLLSVSGLHVTAVVGATMLVVLRLLALFPALALRLRLPVVAALAAAGVAGFYTWLTGSDVPTVRSLIAALIVLAALAMGREAVTLRLVAAGAIIVLLLWPEAIASPSFQLSFAAVTVIVALNEHPRVRGWFAPREEGRGMRFARSLGSLLLTGLVIELALMPIGLFHFHKAGIYGAVANLVAIPLTTFVVMPLEALALVLDGIGLGWPVWAIVQGALDLLLWIARTTASMPGAVTALPTMPVAAFGLMVAGGLWIALWRTRWRWMGAVPFLIGGVWAVTTPSPDLLVTGDGRHVAIRGADGSMRLLRERAGDYVRDVLGEAVGAEGELAAIDGDAGARCSRDLCIDRLNDGQRTWTISATRSADFVPIRDMLNICRTSDIVISDRRLPRGCTPRWLKLDRPVLARTGGLSISFGAGHVEAVRRAGDHPWLKPLMVAPPYPARPQRGRGDMRYTKPWESSATE